jgi:hypothetical protein
MQMLYNSDSFVVVRFDVPDSEPGQPAPVPGPALSRAGYEIVDKFARKEIFIEGALAERFQEGVQSLVASGPTEELLDDFIAGFTATAQQPLVFH